MNGDVNVDSLRQQFQQLQEQHQKKLLLRKQRLSGSSTSSSQKPDVIGNKNVYNTSSSTSGLLGSDIEDDLELEIDNDCSDHVPTKQAYEFNVLIRELKDENGRLYKLLAERDEEMRILRKQVNQERQDMIGSGPASDTAANRIMELSKKNRELASDIEKEKRKVKQLSKKLGELQNQNSSSQQDVSSKDTKTKNRSDKDSTTEEQVSAHNLQEKLKQALAKMAEYRNQCEILKKEVRLAQKVIAKECGEGVNVNAILNEPSGWRGRQQQITTLQNKVNELRQQLNEAARSKLAQSSSSFTSPTLGLQRATTPSFYDEKHKHMLKKMEKNKKEAYEKVSSELETLAEEHNKLQMKFDAAKTRNKILTNELKGLKTQTKMLVEKGTHDDELIAALMREQERLQKSLTKKNSEIADRTQFRQEKVQQDSELVTTLTQLCKEREEKVAKLEHELKIMVSNVRLESPQTHGMSTEFVDKATITDHIFTDNVRSPSIDHQQNGQIDPRDSTVSNSNIDAPPLRRRVVRSSGRNSGVSSLPPTPPRTDSGRRTSAESSGGRSHTGRQREEYHPLYEAVRVERDKLVELVSVLQQREKEAQQAVCKISSEVKNLQRQNVELEKKFARVSAEQNHRSHPEKTRKNQKPHRFKGVPSEEPANELQLVEELQTQLAIQRDENDALKEALEATLHAKKEDFSFYQEIVEQTKRVFLQGLHQYRQTSAPT